MKRDDCMRTFSVFSSPMARFANRLMQGDRSKGEYGMLLRTVDVFDNNPTDLYNVMVDGGIFDDMNRSGIPVPTELPPLKTISSSYLHGSIRAAGGIYQNIFFDRERNQFDFSLLYATNFAKNTIFKDFQVKEKLLDCEYAYLYDAGTIDRGTVFGKSNCWNFQHNALCLGGDNCHANGPGSCNGCRVPPDEFGDFVGRWIEAEGTRETMEYLYGWSCYYDDLEDAVTASNTLWTNRHRWWYDTHSETGSCLYQGYNECATQLHMLEKAWKIFWS